MDRLDMDRIWTLLGKCRMGDAHLKDSSLKMAWALVLEPYTYEDVKQAVAAHFRVSKFWPDIGEIAQYLPDVPTPKDIRERKRREEQMEKAFLALKISAEKSKIPR